MGRWQGFAKFKHPVLQNLVSRIPEVIANSRRPNTMNAYAAAYKRYEEWAKTLEEISVFPTDEYSATLYIITMSQENMSISTINQFVASMRWIHKLGGFDDPGDSHLIKTILEGIKRTKGGNVTHKKPVTKCMIRLLHDKLTLRGNMSLVELRDFTYILLSFCGFLRFDEASNIKRCHITLNFNYFALMIPRSKTDVLAEGQEVLIARTSTKLCPLTWLVRYLSEAGIQNDSDAYIFRSVFHCKKTDKWGLRKTNQPLSYTTISEMFKNRMKSVDVDMENMSLHSLRAGGVTLAAAQGVSERLYKAHGRWRSNAVESYVSEETESKLSVTKKLKM